LVTTGTPEATRLSLRDWVYGFLRALSGESGFLATVASAMRKHRRQLDASVEASRPHDFFRMRMAFSSGAIQENRA
jgi:hypothetical protein